MIKVAQPMIGEEEEAAVLRVLRSGMLAQGPEVAAFESEFSAALGNIECVAVNSGTSALVIGLMANGVGPGDEVIVPAFTFAASANSIALVGATPVFVDVEPDTFVMSADSVNAAISPRTVGIMPVHLYGQAANMSEIQHLADQNGLLVFEDSAQAHLSTWNHQQVGTFGAFGAFSFYPTKNMSAGEGGMITTKDPEVARKSRLLRNQGMEKRYANEIPGFNNRMTDIHAAIGRVQLRKLPGWTRDRQYNAAYLSQGLKGIVKTPYVAEDATHVFHQYTIRVEDRARFQSELTNYGVGSGIYYPIPVNRLPAFNESVELPNSSFLAETVLSLPVHPGLSRGNLDSIIEAVSIVAGSK